MNILKKAAVISAVLFSLSAAAACGNDVPTADESEKKVNIIESATEAESSAEKKTDGVSDDSGNEAVTTDVLSSGHAVMVTRSQEEIDRINSQKPSSKPSSSTEKTEIIDKSSSTSEKVSGITLSYTDAQLIVGQTKTYPVVAETINEIWSSSDESVATVDKFGNITAVGEGECIIRVVSADDKKIGADVVVTVSGNDGIQVVDGITYIDGILIANKSYGLPASYNPGGLTPETSAAFDRLVSAASENGLYMFCVSGFRSYETQASLYDNYASWDGIEAADTYSARPGYSEHQTGLAIDVNNASDVFMGTPEAIWLEEHCTDYGFIIRYPQGKQDITGYKYEPWHIRYVGVEFAEKFKAAAESAGDPYYTLEEFFGIDSYYHN